MILPVAAAPPSIDWQKSYGSNANDRAYGINQTSDGGYIVVGWVNGSSGDVATFYGGYDVWVVKMNSAGTIQWQKTYGGSRDDLGYAIQPTSDGGYIVGGTTDSSDGDVTLNQGDRDYWILKLGSSGDLEWQKTYGGSGSDQLSGVWETSDGRYIAIGTTQSSDGNVTAYHGSNDVWVVKMNSAGDLLWEKALGGSNYEGNNMALIENSLGDFVIATTTESTDGDVTGGNKGGTDYWIVCLEADGTYKWDKTYGGSSNDNANGLIGDDSWGYIISGYSSSTDGNVTGNHGATDYWIVKTDSSGDLMWQKTVGGSGYEETYWDNMREYGGAGTEVPILIGWSNSTDGDRTGFMQETPGTAYNRISDFWIVRLTSSGDLDWQLSLGGTKNDEGKNLALTTDGYFIVSGMSKSDDNDVSGNHAGSEDFWIAKLRSTVAPVSDFTTATTSGTAPLTVLFIDSTANTATSWNWSFGDGSITNSTKRNPIHTFASAGTYTVSLNATNSAGFNTMTKTGYITVSNPSVPVASFTGITLSGTAPLTVQFNETSTNTPTYWNWSFGDGLWFNTTSIASANATHVFSSAGTYTVNLTAGNSVGSNTSSRSNYIVVTVPKPIPSFSATPTSGILPLTVSFTDSSTNTPTGWVWFFGDENFTEPWTQVNPGAGWSARAGHSSVVMPDGSIVLMGGYGGGIYTNDTWRSTDNGTTWTNVTVSAGWPGRQYHSSVVMPDGSIVMTGGRYYSGAWRYWNDTWRSTDKGATWTQMNASAGWSARGTHSSVALSDGSLILMGGQGDLGDQNDVWRSTDNGAMWTVVNPSALWSARWGHNSVAMPDDSIVLMGGYNLNDVWRSTDKGATWTQKNISVGWSGRYNPTSVAMPDGSIVLMGGYGGSYKNDLWRSTDNGAKWTVVNASAGWTARESHNGVAMPDGSIILMGGYDGTSNKNDVWRFKPFGSSLQNPSHTYTSGGVFQVALQAFNTGGYNSTRKTGYITVTGGAAPVANLNGTPTSGTVPLTVQFRDDSTNSPTIWNWSFGDGSLVQADWQDPIHTYTSAGTYTVSLNATNSGGSNTAIKTNYIFVDFASIAMFRGKPLHTGVFDDGGTRPTANLKWKIATGGSVGSSPVIANNILYIGSDDGKIYAVNATNGAPVWNTSVGINIRSVPAVADGVVYIGSWDKKVYALSALTGSSVWTYTTGDYITSSPAVANGIVYIGSHDSFVYALNASTGVPFWTYSTGTTSADSSPAIANGIVYVGSSDSRLHALNATTGVALWTNSTLAGQVISSPAVSNGVVYVGSFNDRMYALNATTGIILWEYATTGCVDSSPAVFGNAVYVGSDDKDLYALNALTGTKLWNFTTTGSIKSSPAVANGRVYVGSNDGSLYVLDNSTGSELLHYATGSTGVRSSPWVENGTVFFGSDDKSVYALGGSGTVPVANFTGTPTTGNATLIVTFTDSSTNTPTSWNWSFGDATYSTTQNPSHTYTTAGTYTISLNATNAFGTNTKTLTGYITVSSPPAYYSVGQIINPGASVYIGEQGLNVTHSLNEGSPNDGNIDGIPVNKSIGWWPSAAIIESTAPTKRIDLSTRYRSIVIDPADFVGYTGTWYVINVTTDRTASAAADSAIFKVVDPSLDMSVWDFTTSATVSGSSVSRNDNLGFRITTNLIDAINSSHRTPVYNDTRDGYLDIRVKNPSGTLITSLKDKSGVGHSLLQQNVSFQPWTWGNVSSASSNWSVGVLNGSGGYEYPPGAYTVWVESGLNNMRSNYKNTGVDYTGKTISPVYTVTLSNLVPVASFSANITNGTVPFAVQFTDTSTGSPTSWNWDFGDANTSTLQNPVYTFVLPQVFNVTLKATNAAGSATSAITQITGFGKKVETTTVMNGTTESTVNGKQVLSVNTTTIESTGGSVTNTSTTITITGGNTFWNNTQLFAENVALNTTTGDYTVTNMTQVVMQSAPVSVALNESVGTVSVSLDVALKQYVSAAPVNITITQGATTNTVNAFQLAAQDTGLNLKEIAYTVQFTNTGSINANLTQNTTRQSQAVILTMNVKHSWVARFANSTNNDGRDSIAILRSPDTGSSKVLTTRFDHYDSVTGLDWFEGDSPDGLSIFGMIGYSAQQASSSQSSGSSSGGYSGSSGSGKTDTKADVKEGVSPKKAPNSPTQFFKETATLNPDKSGLLPAEVNVQSLDQVALITLQQGSQATDTSGQPLTEISLQPEDSSTMPPRESGTQYAFSGLAYKCGPDGAQFSPSVTLTLTLTPDQWSNLHVNGREPVIRTYSTSAKSWESLLTNNDPDTLTVSTEVTHFSDFALFSKPVQNGNASAVIPAQNATAVNAAKPPANAFEIMAGLGLWGSGLIINNPLLAVIGIIVIGIGYVGWVQYRKKKEHDLIMYGRRK